MSDEPLPRPRCKAITFAGQPNHLLVRCSLEEHETGSHIPSWTDGDKNYPPGSSQ